MLEPTSCRGSAGSPVFIMATSHGPTPLCSSVGSLPSLKALALQ